MITVSNQRIRLALDVTEWSSTPTDIITSASPVVANGADLQFELIFSYGVLTSDAQIVSTTNWASLNVQLKQSVTKDGLDLWGGAGTVSNSAFNTGITYANWAAGTAQQVKVNIPGANNSILLTADQQQFWIVMYAQTSDSPAQTIPVAAFPVVFIRTGLGVTPPSYVTPSLYYTQSQSDARYTQISNMNAYAPLAGATFTGAVVLAANPTVNLGAATKQYVDAVTTYTAAHYLNLTGGSLSGGVAITGNSSVTGTFGVSSTLTLGSLSGVLKATAGAVAGSATTSDLTEGSNLYFTNARAIAATLTGFTATSGTVNATDTVLQAFQKLAYSVNNAFSGATVQAAANQAAMLALSSSVKGDYAFRSDTNTVYVYKGGGASTLSNWAVFLYPSVVSLPAGALTLVTASGTSTIVTDNVGEGSTNLYYTNARALAQAQTLLTGSTFSGVLNFSGTANAGLIVNNLSTAQIAALTPSNGNVVYDSTAGALKACIGGAYYALQTGTGGITLSSALAGYAAAAGTISTSTTVLGAFNILGALATGITVLQFTGSSNVGLIVNQLTTTQINALSVTSASYGGLVYDVTLNKLKVYTNAGWSPLLSSATYLPLSAGSSFPLTAELYFQDGLATNIAFGATWSCRTSGSNANFDILQSSTVVLTCNSSNVVTAPNGYFNSPYGYQLNGTNILTISGTTMTVNMGSSWAITTTASFAALTFGYGSAALSINQSNQVSFSNPIYMGSNKVIDSSNYFYDSSAHQILASQQGAIADFSAAGGWSDSTAYTDFSNLVTKVNAILAMIRTHGLIAS